MMIIFRLWNGDYSYDDGTSSWNRSIEDLRDMCERCLLEAKTPNRKFQELQNVVFHETSIILRDHCDYKFKQGIVYEDDF